MYEHRNEPGQNRYLVYYLLLCLLFSFVRATWIFWIVAILPYARSKADFVLKTVAFIACVGIAFLYTKYFCAAAYVGLGRSLTRHTSGNVLVQFIQNSAAHFFANIQLLLFSFKAFGMRAPLLWNISKYITPLALLYFSYRYYVTRNVLILSSLAVSLCLYGIMLLLYTPEYPFFMKITTSVFILNFVVAVYLDEIPLKWFYLGALSLCFPLTLYTGYHLISVRKASYADLTGKYKEDIAQLQLISKLVDASNGVKTIAILPGEFTTTIPTAILFSALPYSTPEHSPIRYSWFYKNNAVAYENNFPQPAHLKTDYILCKNPMEHRDDLKLLHTNNLFYFYQITSLSK
jgi:hypothetical protein